MNLGRAKRFLLFALAAVLIGLTVQQGSGDAWVSQYIYASAPAKKEPPPKPVAPPAVQEPDIVMQPKPVALSKRVTEYHIDVNLQEDAHMLTGEQTVTWTNPGRLQVSELYFHLYPNAFRSKDTTFMRESGGQLRNDKATVDSVGYMNLLSLETTEGYSLLPRLHYIQPDDGNTNDLTLAKLRLPAAVAPGKSVTLRMKFEVKLPEVFARMGYAGNFVMAGQWFPKLAVYETAGTRGRAADGWNIHQYHGNSEFYSDFGIYSVKINVPSSYKVAATGFQTKASVVADGRKTYQFYADDVHDFGWSASPDFVYAEEPFSTEGVPGVRIKLYLDPQHAKFKDRYMHAAKSALAKYAQWYGAYPYSTLSIVVPPKGGNGAGGMEYPTLITAFAAENDNPGYDLERTVVHEIGHQYWYGMVASNEFEEAWLDEGFTSYAEDKVMESEYGVEPNLPVESSYMTDPAPLKQLSWSYHSNNHYAENVYMRAKLVLYGIEKQVGAQTMRKIMRTYFQKYKFKHPSTADFQKVVETVTKKKWNDYFSHFVYGSDMSDYAVASIHVRPVKQDGKTLYESVVLIKKTGGSFGPVTVVFQFADGTIMPKVWDGQEDHIQYKLVHSAKLVWAAVDPQHDNVLDNKHINNFMKADLTEKTRTRWSVGITKLLETIFAALAW
ncbi:M1 family metallopeptidase [Paenibacillus sp. OV219]|uniref:M1 family metallopeptidase n=1 Tax=Paenibacillus sp. OV219 TaxID=1884377 RepID=UPI0008D70A36|nr:M1 family metallopeptidase [Paenibacillus sp. OV219]SEO84252.1 Peptidase family M1 [Paenibacillus sp. OV219]